MQVNNQSVFLSCVCVLSLTRINVRLFQWLQRPRAVFTVRVCFDDVVGINRRLKRVNDTPRSVNATPSLAYVCIERCTVAWVSLCTARKCLATRFLTCARGPSDTDSAHHRFTLSIF